MPLALFFFFLGALVKTLIGASVETVLKIERCEDVLCSVEKLCPLICWEKLVDSFVVYTAVLMSQGI